MNSYSTIYRNLRESVKNAPALFEEAIQSVYQTVLRPGATAIDVGAHTGKHTFAMAKCVGPRGRVLAFEPIREKYDILQNKIEKEGWSQIDTFNCCLFSENKIIIFHYLPADPGKSSINLRQSIEDDKNQVRISRAVLSIKADAFFDNLLGIGFVKIDAEGAEFDILNGMKDLIAANRPVLHMELANVSLGPFGVSPISVYQFVAGRGYVMMDILGNLLETPDAYEQSINASGCYDYIAVNNTDSESDQISQVLKGFWLKNGFGHE